LYLSPKSRGDELDEIDQSEYRKDHQREEKDNDNADERPVSAGIPRSTHGFAIDLNIADIGFEGEIEDVADQRNHSQKRVESHIQQHSHDRRTVHAMLHRAKDDQRTDDAGCGIAESGDQANEPIESE